MLVKNFLKLSNLNSKCSYRCLSKWKQPEGYDTKIMIYNHMERKQVPFIVKNKCLVSWYTCGPTVYDSAHVGHASCYMHLDILQRILKNYFHLNLVTVMNITDIDDKIITRALTEGKSHRDISNYYEKEFWEDMEAMGIEKPNKIERVSENIKLIIDFIENLINNDFAYKGKDLSIYFNVENYNKSFQYGKLNLVNLLEPLKSDVKKNNADFVLWKAAKEKEPFWESPFGKGRPGWHIECSAIAAKTLGSCVDVHCGGIDLRFPHHENEEAQSCAFNRVDQWVNYWLHVGHLHLPGAEKMSKSLKNTLSIRDFLKQHDAQVLRMACLLTNYRDQMDFSQDLISSAESLIKSLKHFFDSCQLHFLSQQQISIEDGPILMQQLQETCQNVDESLRNDFNTFSCLQSITKLVHLTNKCLKNANATESKSFDFNFNGNHNKVVIAIVNYLQQLLDNCFGLKILSGSITEKSSEDLAKAMDLLVDLRYKIRSKALETKDKELLKLCDEVRIDCYEKLGISLKDHAKISTWVK